jgi:hypothetical protein
MNSTHTEIYLRSSDATQVFNGNKKSDVIFILKNSIIPPQGYYMLLKLKKMYFPVSFYIIDSTNNSLYISNILYTIPIGNYTSSTLVSTLTDILPSTFSITFSSITNKLTIINSSDFTINSNSTCLTVLGFDSNTSYTSTLNTLTSEYPVDLSGNNIVYVSISNLRTNNTDAGTSNSVSSIISSILINVPYGYLQYYDSSDNTGLILLEDHISFLHVSILGEDAMTLLDFHNQNWAMTLIIQFVPKNDYHTPPNNLNMSDLYKNYLKTLKIN